MCFLILMRNAQIADVRNPGEGVGENKNGIAPVKTIGEQQERTGQTQPPKGGWHDDSFLLLRRIPLDKKAGEENDIADPADHFHGVPLDAEEIPVVPD